MLFRFVPAENGRELNSWQQCQGRCVKSWRKSFTSTHEKSFSVKKRSKEEKLLLKSQRNLFSLIKLCISEHSTIVERVLCQSGRQGGSKQWTRKENLALKPSIHLFLYLISTPKRSKEKQQIFIVVDDAEEKMPVENWKPTNSRKEKESTKNWAPWITNKLASFTQNNFSVDNNFSNEGKLFPFPFSIIPRVSHSHPVLLRCFMSRAMCCEKRFLCVGCWKNYKSNPTTPLPSLHPQTQIKKTWKMRWHAPVAKYGEVDFYAIKVTNNSCYCSEEIFMFLKLNNAENMTRNYPISLQHLVLQKKLLRAIQKLLQRKKKQKGSQVTLLHHPHEREKCCSMFKSMCDGAFLFFSFLHRSSHPPSATPFALLCLYVLFGCSFFVHIATMKLWKAFHSLSRSDIFIYENFPAKKDFAFEGWMGVLRRIMNRFMHWKPLANVNENHNLSSLCFLNDTQVFVA